MTTLFSADLSNVSSPRCSAPRHDAQGSRKVLRRVLEESEEEKENGENKVRAAGGALRASPRPSQTFPFFH